MQKSILAVLVIVLLCTMIPVSITASMDDYYIAYQKFYLDMNGNHTEIQQIMEGEILAKAQVGNMSNSKKSVTLITSVYEGNKLQQVTLTKEEIPANTSATLVSNPLTIAVSAGETLSNYTMKQILVENLTNLMPIAVAVPLTAEAPVPTPSPSATAAPDYGYLIYDELDNQSKLFAKSANLGFYEDSISTEDRQDAHTVTVVRRNGSSTNGEGYLTYSIDDQSLYAITVTAYYYDGTGYAGAAQNADKDTRLEAVLQREGLKFYQSSDNTNYTEVTDIALTKAPSNWADHRSHKVTYCVKDLIPGAKYFKIYYPPVDDDLFAQSVRVDNVQIEYATGGARPAASAACGYTVQDTLADDSVLHEISNNLEFKTANIQTLRKIDGAFTDYVERVNGQEAFVTYQLDGNPMNTASVEMLFYDNGGYAGCYDENPNKRVEAVIEKENIAFYESADGVNYRKMNQAAVSKDPSPYPGLSRHKVVYEISGFQPTSRYFKIVFPPVTDSTIYYWSAMLSNVTLRYASGRTTADLNDIRISDYPRNKISVISPDYAGNVYGDTKILLIAPGFTRIAAVSWKQDENDGFESYVGMARLDERGVGVIDFRASEFPHGPITLILSGENGELTDECHLQLYNHAGISWNEGTETAPIPDIVTQKGLSLIYEDDFEALPTISWGNSNTDYCSHKPGYQDFSDIYFTDYESAKNPFSQVDTYLRIRADQELMSSGILSSVHQDRTGFAAKAPVYFECRFIAQNAKGTWPAFWLLTTTDKGENPNGTDELDIIEAYGFDNRKVTGYTATKHNWGQTPNEDEGYVYDMSGTDKGFWYTNFHTYGCYIGPDYTIYYCDNDEIWRHRTMPISASDYHYFLIDLAVGGISGWPYDLTRYKNLSDMYVDWVRVYGLQENVMQ